MTASAGSIRAAMPGGTVVDPRTKRLLDAPVPPLVFPTVMLMTMISNSATTRTRSPLRSRSTASPHARP